jgi:hypothetical protein
MESAFCFEGKGNCSVPEISFFGISKPSSLPSEKNTILSLPVQNTLAGLEPRVQVRVPGVGAFSLCVCVMVS